MKYLIFLLLASCYMMRIMGADVAMVSVVIGKEFKEATILGLQNKENYCKKQGYDFIYCEECLDSTRQLNWSKILFLLNVMENSKCKWIFWTDADALVMNTEMRLEDLIDEDYNLIINYDFNGFNNGHFLIRNCEWSRKFLREAYTHDEFINDPEFEQGAMLKTLQQNYEYMKVTKIIPQRLMNSYSDLYIGKFLQASYQPGDFILHFAGIRDLVLLKQAFEHYYPLVQHHVRDLSYHHYLGIYGVLEFPSLSAIPLFALSSDLQRSQYVEQLQKIPGIETIAQVGVVDGLLAELFFSNCPQLNKCATFVSKRYNIFGQAAWDFLSRKYRKQWEGIACAHLTQSVKEYALGSEKKPFDLIHINFTQKKYDNVRNLLINTKELADSHTLIWINNYHYPITKAVVDDCVRAGILEITHIHNCDDTQGHKSWIEARYK